MAKRKKTTFADIHDEERTEFRHYYVYREGLEHRSSNTIYFDCPFCNRGIKAYLWSLAGGGKACECGAIFASGSRSWKLKELIDDQVEEDHAVGPW